MSPGLLIFLYCGAIVLASLLGGWLPSRLRLTHTRMQVTISFVAGLMLGVGLLHMLPHSVHGTGSTDLSVTWLVAGLLTTFFLIRLFQFHQHPPVEEEFHRGPEQRSREPPPLAFSHQTEPALSSHAVLPHEKGSRHQFPDPAAHAGQSCGHPHHAKHVGLCPHELSWVGVAVGLTLHSALDGVALAASMAIEERSGGAYLFGLGTFLGVLLHKPLDALSITTLMTVSGWPVQFRQMVNAAFALVCPLAAIGFYFGLSGLADTQHELTVGCALAFSAGMFLCIALGDLLPELQFHTHDRVKLSVALVLGVALAWCVGYLEPKHTHAPVRNAEFGMRSSSSNSALRTPYSEPSTPHSALRTAHCDARR